MPTDVRDEYFAFFNKNGVHYPALGNLSKPTIGGLSPGCRSCIDGTWSCIFINSACTKDCFYCPCPQNDRKRKPVVPENLSFSTVHDYIGYLKTFDYSSVAFSGGEPLLAIDIVLEYIHEIKRCFGDRHFIWAYTNGDLATRRTLSLLNKAGLHELRFDIAANNYDLTALEKAVEYIDIVSVEIPAIPEDLDILKPLLKDLEKIGVKHLNVHQLMKTEYNSEKMTQRGYTPVNADQYPDQTPIMESELAALEILKHAIEIQSGLGINYCSRCYKYRFQGRAHRKRAALFCGDKRPDVTKTGYLRKAVIDASSEAASFLGNHLDRTELEIAADGEKSLLVFSLDHFSLLLTENYCKTDIVYYEPVLVCDNNNNTGSGQKSPEMIGGNAVYYQENVKFRRALENTTSAFLFYTLFVENMNIEAVTREIMNAYGVNADSGGNIIRDIHDFYRSFQGIEYLPHDLEPYE